MKVLDGIIGFAVGDAMGVPVEFVQREKLLQAPLVNMVGGGSHGMPKGSWSDDTSMTLATIDAIIETNEINLQAIADNFIEWFRKAKYTPTNKVFDIGRTTLQALAKVELKTCSPEMAGGTGEYDNGNGSLMRILPIVYWCYAKKYNKEEIYNVVKSVSSITHRHEVSIMGCYIYVLFAIEILKGKSFKDALKIIKKEKYSMFSCECIKRYDRILKGELKKYKLEDISSQGYIVSTLESVLWVLLNTDSYNQAIIGAINLGNDTDTVGACVGGIAGIKYGFESINDEWKKTLIKYDYIVEMCEKFNNELNRRN